jgi:DNA-binding NarL/FixJ family response regulator
MKNEKITVVIADDHSILRSGLRMLLGAQPDMNVVGEANNGDEALEQVRLKRPAVLILDISMPGSNGIEVIHDILKISPQTRVLILTMHAEAAYLDAVLTAGATGFVLKRSLDSDLLNAIRAVRRGDNFIDAGMTKFLVQKALGGKPAESSAKAASSLLSRRELQVLTLAAQGHTNRQISLKLFVSVKSVETYRARLLKKLNLEDRAQMFRFAVEAGLLSSDPVSHGAS